MTHPFDAISLDQLRLRRSDKWRHFPPDVIPLWVAEMDYPLAEPIEWTLHDMIARGDTGYPTPAGLPEAYAAFAAARFGAEVDPSMIYPLGDIVRGIHLSLRLFTEPGDGVVINPPVYPPFYTAIRYAERRVIEAPLARDPSTGRWALDPDALERAFARGAAAYLLCSPHNPTGRVWTRDELQTVADLAARHRVRVISDEVHAPLTYPGAGHTPFNSLDEPAAGDAVVLTSASKAWNLPGLKCALAISASPEVAEAFRGLPPEIWIEPSILGIAANETAFREGVPWLDGMLAYLAANRDWLDEALPDRLPGVRWVPPEATYLGWLDCRDLGLGDDPAAELLKRSRVALSPGMEFGPGGAGFVRINFATSRAILEEGVERLAAAIGSSRPAGGDVSGAGSADASSPSRDPRTTARRARSPGRPARRAPRRS